MNRRNFFGAIGAASTALVFGREAEIRYVMFNSPSAKICAIYWMRGHVATERFVSLYSEIEEIATLIQPSAIKQGWATRKLSGIGIYLSDRPLENFEPITYWIPADYNDQEVTL